jgi:hypothetical protein
MNRSQNRLASLVAAMLLVASALYAVGTAIEHSQRGKRHTEQKGAVPAPAKSGETSAEQKANGEGSGSTETSPESPGEATPETGGETHSEKIAGVDPESWPLVGTVIAVSLLVAFGVYRRRSGWLVAAIVLGLAFAAADVCELAHQLQESRTTVAMIAGASIALHLLVALGAAAARRAGQTVHASPAL